MKAFKVLIVFIAVMAVGIVWFKGQYPHEWDQIIYPLDYEETISKASKEYGLDPYLICGIIYVESKFNPASESRVGAKGLMQVMPDTGVWVSQKQGRLFKVGDLDEPSVNIDIGCWYFSFLQSKYRDESLALAAYNSGDKNVDIWLKQKQYRSIQEMVNQIPYKETREFIGKVDDARKAYKRIYPDEFKISSPVKSEKSTE